MSDLRILLEQEQKKLDLLRKVTQLDERYRRELKEAVEESGLSHDVLPFDLRAAGLVSIKTNGPYSGLSIPEAARRFLQEQPTRSATTPEIAHALLSGGIRTNAKNFTATLYTILSQNQRWFRRKGQSWVLVEEKK